MAAYPEQGVGNDLEAMGVAFLQGPPFTLMISLTLAEADHYSNMPTAKMLSLGGERLPPPPHPPKKNYGVFCSFTHLRILRSAPKFNQFFIVLLRTPP